MAREAIAGVVRPRSDHPALAAPRCPSLAKEGSFLSDRLL